ncbi:Bifunctional purine biosynthetic protein ade1 [Dinochytrium kinnereticum]|nr:Bifunctional purine biosynthetic protein ade1 [Dinochytrium kinnereticum]
MIDLGYISTLVLWGFLPKFAADLILKQIYHFVYGNGGPPQNHPVRKRHFAVVFSVVVLGYLGYSLVQTERSLPPNHYHALHLSPLGYDAKELRTNYRALSLQFHPDKAQSVDPEAAAYYEANYMRIRDAYEILKDPVLKAAYDKFGNSILDCQRCKIEKDFVKDGISDFISFYTGTTFVLIIFSLLGKGDFGRYWRFATLLLMAGIESSVLWRSSPRPLYFLPWRTVSENIEIMHQVFIAVSIAGTQIGPVIWPARTLDLKGQIDELEQLTMMNLSEATLQFRSAFEPFGRDSAAAGLVQRKMEKMAVELKIMEKSEMEVTNSIPQNCPDLKLIARGKVRDLYDVSNEHLLFVATDRISAFDVIMKNGIPAKGILLTSMSEFWFNLLKDIISNHLVTSDISKMPASVGKYKDQLEGRSMLVKKLKILPVEAIVRGYITGSGWAEYKKKGTVCDIPLPEGLKECEKLPRPLFTPSTKAELGDHGTIFPFVKAGLTYFFQMRTFTRANVIFVLLITTKTISILTAFAFCFIVVNIIGKEYAEQMEQASEYALSKGIIIADTKFEFGVDENGKLVLADEVLTPGDLILINKILPVSGRQTFTLPESPSPGLECMLINLCEFKPTSLPALIPPRLSYDKQYLRDYLESIKFDKSSGIELPTTVTSNTLSKYKEACTIITGGVPAI